MLYRTKLLAVAIAAISVAPLDAAADEVDDGGRGLALAQEVERRDAGYVNIAADGVLTNRSASGGSNVRRFEMVTAEVTGDGDRRLIIVTAPASLRGTAFLTHPHVGEPDDTWMRLAGEGRTRRIASSDKSSRFLSSQFSLEDITPWELPRYTYTYLGETACGDSTCFIIENRPIYAESSYSRQIELLDKEIYRPREITYWNRAGEKVKKLEFMDYNRYGGRYWRPGKMRMTNLVSGDSSEIAWTNYQVDTGLGASALTPRNLSRLAP